jgi:flagellar basal-body rod protein FlgC
MTNAIDVLSAGLSVARMRVNILASNIANAETTRTDEGGPYKRRDIVQVGMPQTDDTQGFDSLLKKASLVKPSVRAVVADQEEPRKVFQPGHPDADGNGFVEYPNINVVTTMTDLMSASRLYQANATAIEAVRGMERDASTLISSG